MGIKYHSTLEEEAETLLKSMQKSMEEIGRVQPMAVAVTDVIAEGKPVRPIFPMLFNSQEEKQFMVRTVKNALINVKDHLLMFLFVSEADFVKRDKSADLAGLAGKVGEQIDSIECLVVHCMERSGKKVIIIQPFVRSNLEKKIIWMERQDIGDAQNAESMWDGIF